MFLSLFGAFEAGLIYALMALGVYISFRVLNFPDLTVDGSFVTGAAVASVLIINGHSPVYATMIAIVAGFIAGCFTGLLHTKGKINPLLSGILMMIALYSINIRIMGRPNIPLLQESTLFTSITAFWENVGLNAPFNQMLSFFGIQSNPETWAILFFALIIALIVKFLTDYFLKTEVGLALRATGDNQRMIRSLSANTNVLIVLGLGISNAFVAFSGALVAQYSGSADAGMGIGMIVIGLASVIIGEALFGTKTIARTTLAVIGGSIIYRIVVSLALRADFLDTSDMKLITSVIVISALVAPKVIESNRERRRRKRKRLELEQVASINEGENKNVAT